MAAADVELWIFGYGSLMWRPDFPHAERRSGFVEDWTRRFWQGSPDHRGVPADPGRVVTLVGEPGGRCWGEAFRVEAPHVEEVLLTLERRESGGFERHGVDVHFAEAPRRIRASVYVAGAGNPNFLGSASLESIAAQARRCCGRSGSNREYVLRLADALRTAGVEDEHVFAVADLLREGAA